jgi:hypothetical protein
MISPCKQCLVTAMCKKWCGLLVSYLEDNLIQEFIPMNHEYQYLAIAYQLRRGILTETDGAIRRENNGHLETYLCR